MATKTKETTPAPGTMHLPPAFIGSASTDKTRAVITGVLVDAENRFVVATNGRILASLPIPGTETVKPAYITPDLWKAAKVLTKNKPLVLDYVAGTLNGLPLPDECPDGNYPNWKQVLPDFEPAYRVALDPELLLSLAASLGRDKTDRKALTLELSAESGDPVKTHIRTKTGIVPGMGVIMPFITDRSVEHGPLAARPEATAHPAAPAPERSPAPGGFDRAAMMKDPIAWLKLLDLELRHLGQNHPSGGQWISDYLEMVDRSEIDDLRDRLDERPTTEDHEHQEDLVKTYEAMLKRIIEALETSPFDSIGEAAIALEVIASVLTESDHALAFDYEKIQSRLDTFEKLDPSASAPAAASDSALREKLAAAEARNALLEAELANRPAAAPEPERSPAPAPAAKAKKPKKEVPAASAPPVLSRNAERNGIELRFNGKPDDETIAALKGHGFRWAPGQEGQPWWVRYSEERWVFANRLAEGGGIQPTTPDKPEATPAGAETRPPAPTPEPTPDAAAKPDKKIIDALGLGDF